MYDPRYKDQLLSTFSVLRRTWLAIDRLLDGEFASVGLTPAKVGVLWCCQQSLAPIMNLTEIARSLSLSKPTVADLLGRMEKEGLIERERKKGSQPFTEVRVTSKGAEASELGKAKFKAALLDIMSGFSVEEQKQLSNLTHKMLDNTAARLNITLSTPPGRSPDDDIPVSW